jgi:hypothetical protein
MADTIPFYVDPVALALGDLAEYVEMLRSMAYLAAPVPKRPVAALPPADRG